MKARLGVIFLIIVLLPLLLLVWLGLRVSHDEEFAVRQNFQDLLTAKLKDTNSEIARLLQRRERELLRITEPATFPALLNGTNPLSDSEVEALRDLARGNPRIRQVFVLAPDGKLLHPSRENHPTTSEAEFVQRAWRMLANKELLHPAQPHHTSDITKNVSDADVDSSDASTSTPAQRAYSGWYAWHWETGLNLIFWRRLDSGHIVGVELDPTRWMADIIARLPGTSTTDALPAAGSIALIDSNGAAAYQWGAYLPPTGEAPRASLELSAPLHSWKLNYYLPATGLDAALKERRAYALSLGLLAVCLSLAGLAFYFYREYSRDLREAAQRVSFVNQVSHELKTPLTNIRLYAELLETELAQGDAANPPEKMQRYLAVIVSESQRLSRLIANVLTLAGNQKREQRLHRAPGSIDAVVQETIEQFRPALELKGVVVTFQRGAASSVWFDADALRQIVGNLISNVEKYGASGGVLEIVTQQQTERTTVTVADRGPGIPKAERVRIFQPFYRPGRKLTDNASGTGIGLTIARDLARLHGGDLVLDSESRGVSGARFILTLHTSVAEPAELPPEKIASAEPPAPAQKIPAATVPSEEIA